MRYTYLLLHPSANIIIDFIFKIIEEKNVLVKAVYKIEHWDEILDEIYVDSYSRAESVRQHVHAHAYINKYMFGDNGLVLILESEGAYEELIQKTLIIKQTIRQYRNETKNGTLSIFLNLDLLRDDCIEKSRKEKGKIEKYNEYEKSTNVYFSYVHCADTKEQYQRDFKVLNKYMIKQLDESEIDFVIKYRSFL